MSEKTEKRRADLRVRIIDAAEEAVAAGGLHSLRARDLARTAGCAVGAIYTVFDDMTEIILSVNGRTFQRLGHAVSATLEASPPARPVDALILMSKGYLRFAAENNLAWRALFDVEMSVKEQVPDWYNEELHRLFALIAKPLTQMHADKSTDDIALLTRALFSSVHGIVLLGLEQRISAVPLPKIEDMLETVLTNFAGAANPPAD